VNQCYGLTWSGVSTFSAPVQYCIGYGPDQLAAVTNKPESFLIGFAGADGNWAFVKPTVDAPNQRICAASDRLLAWAALFAPQTATAVLPTVGDPFEPGWLLAWGILGSVLVLGAGLILRRQFPLSK
jgi:hypothetical protein